MSSQSSFDIDLIVGLGNPGPNYAKHRHNVGFWFINQLCQEYSAVLRPESRMQAEVATSNVQGKSILLAKPMLYMNESGRAVQHLAHFYKIPAERILIVHDELDLMPGTIRFKEGGGLAGHNGLKSIQQCLSNQNFKRLRVGIGHPGDRNQVSHYVLNAPSIAETNQINESMDFARALLPELLQKEKRQLAINRLHALEQT